jgi:hypothetical protein
MSKGRKVLGAWLVTGGLAIVALPTLGAVGAVVGGLILFAWGGAITTNYRGVAEAMPRRWGIGPIWQETSRGQVRLTFAFFGVIGLVLLASGLHRLTT